MASSMELACTKLSTGPKISVLASWLVDGRPSRTVGVTKFPDSYLGTLVLRPSRMGFAPSPTPAEIRDSMRCLLSLVITGPIWMPASRPLPTRIEEAACAMESRKVFWASPIVTATETARHRWPAQPNALSLMICVASSMSASGSTMT